MICVGGVVGLNTTSLSNSGFIGIIDAETNASDDKNMFFGGLDKVVTVYAGGVVGVSQYSEIKNCYADVNYLADGKVIQKSEEIFALNFLWSNPVYQRGIVAKGTAEITSASENYARNVTAIIHEGHFLKSVNIHFFILP